MKRYQVLNDFMTYTDKGKPAPMRRGTVLTETEVATWLNLGAMLGTMIVEIPGGGNGGSSH